MNRFNIRLIGFLLILAVGVILAQGCSSKSTNLTPPSTHSAHFHAVSIQDFSFSPTSLAIAVGDTVEWTNNGGSTHTVTSDSPGTELSAQLTSSQIYQHMFTTAGSFPYHCNFHASMHGSVTVQ